MDIFDDDDHEIDNNTWLETDDNYVCAGKADMFWIADFMLS